MRVIGGMHKGRKIKSLKGKNTRPTADIVREALFDILGGKIAGSRFLDLFAGTGAVGIEALSRGSESAIFVEKSLEACLIIKQNLENLALTEKSRIIRDDAESALKNLLKQGEEFDIIFMDPPYSKNKIEPILSILRDFEPLKSIIVIQHAEDELFNTDGFLCYKRKKYGKSMLTFLIRE